MGQPARDIRSFFPGAATASTTARPPPPPGPAVGAGPSHQPRRQPHAASSGPVRSGGQPLAAAVRAGRLECLGIGAEDAAEIPADDADGADLPPPVPVDEAAAASWVYPTNMPVRPYQHSITKTALLHNTLVCLPTGMGKTLIAAAVRMATNGLSRSGSAALSRRVTRRRLADLRRQPAGRRVDRTDQLRVECVAFDPTRSEQQARHVVRQAREDRRCVRPRRRRLAEHEAGVGARQLRA